ncbi:hypothetical protein BDV96DRAFT_500348 [Lophiotrema nucula]|uniref:DUF1446-domain-containing protein n=1 Tax=Lophiotrema nucula TaxID=690887 RepID=A0A6A5YVM1_9PLEO|nr:hypothetical protein BDV96DRAFT_500348 [Lophiotrema nucula]
MPSAKSPVRIGGASGGFADRSRSIHDLAKAGIVDVIIGDWMSECTMTIHGTGKINNKKSKEAAEAAMVDLFDPSFMLNLGPALPYLVQNNVKVAVNAGASAPHELARVVAEEVKKQNLDLKVAWVEGDDVTEQVFEAKKAGERFVSLDTGKTLDEWGHEPQEVAVSSPTNCSFSPRAYLGGWGICQSLKAGADIVICGRVTDPAPVVGAAAWWHGWDRANFDALAGSLMAGHIIECSTYATGGYYSGFKNLMDGCENLGYPVAAIDFAGNATFTKEANTGGEVSVGTITSQLVYEIQGPIYYNPDVAANIEGISFEQVSKDEVRMTGVRGVAPPPTTKIGITAHGGYQAEFHYLLCGLDMKEKAAWTEKQVRYSMRNHIDKFSKVRFHLVGSPEPNPQTQDAATCDFRIFVQTKDPSILGWASLGGAENFMRWCMQNFLQSCPGASITPDARQAAGKPILEYWPTLLPQNVIKHKAICQWNGESIEISAPEKTEPYTKSAWSYETKQPVDLASFGPTTYGPMGWVVAGRSGDKAADANIGLFVRHNDEWDWLRTLLSTNRMIALLGPEYLGHGIDRFEMPNIRAVHFLIRDHLDRGFNTTSSLDALGKNLCEFLRAKYVEIPNKFLERGRI